MPSLIGVAVVGVIVAPWLKTRIVVSSRSIVLTIRDIHITFWDMPLTHVRSAALTQYAEVARSLSLDPFAQLRAAGLDARVLHEPDLKIPVARVNTLLESSAHAADIDDFGLRMAMSRRVSNLGLIALAAREEPTVREALRCLQRSMHLHNEAIQIDIEETNDIVILREQFLARVQGSLRQAIELAVAVLYGVVREFLGSNWSPMAVCFMHGPPRDLANYRKAFACSVQFNSVLNGLTCRRRDLDRAMPASDPASSRIIQQYLAEATAYAPSHTERTTRLILGLLPSGRCTTDAVARYLDIDRRTLHRWLQSEGTTFSALLDDTRREAAQRHLGNPQQSLADLSLMLGFSDRSAFSRWFSTKFGLSPRRWRSQVRDREPRDKEVALRRNRA
jgi:AraC-like DNA-binding protein